MRNFAMGQAAKEAGDRGGEGGEGGARSFDVNFNIKNIYMQSKISRRTKLIWSAALEVGFAGKLEIVGS